MMPVEQEMQTIFTGSEPGELPTTPGGMGEIQLNIACAQAYRLRYKSRKAPRTSQVKLPLKDTSLGFFYLHLPGL